MAKKPESKLQRRIKKALEREIGGFWRKVWGGPYQVTFLDLVGCVNGMYFELEVKNPKKRKNTSDLQDITIDLVQLAGGVSGVVTSPEEAVRLVRVALSRATRRGRLHSETEVRSSVRTAANGKNFYLNGRPAKTKVAARPSRVTTHPSRDRLGSRR